MTVSGFQGARSLFSNLFFFLSDKLNILSEEDKKKQKKRAEVKQKESTAIKMLSDLYQTRHKKKVHEVIDALFEIHNFHRIVENGTHDGYSPNMIFYCLISEIHHSPSLTQADAGKLLEILYWPEVRHSHYSSLRVHILEIVGRFPTKASLERLHYHLVFLTENKSWIQTGTQYYRELCNEIIRTQRIIELIE